MYIVKRTVKGLYKRGGKWERKETQKEGIPFLKLVTSISVKGAVVGTLPKEVILSVC